MNFTDKAIQGAENIWQKTPQQVLSNASDMTAAQRAFVRQNPDYVYKPQLANAKTAESLGLTNEYDKLSNSLYTDKGKVAEGFYKTDVANKILNSEPTMASPDGVSETSYSF
jgi:hypothetical protein